MSSLNPTRTLTSAKARKVDTKINQPNIITAMVLNAADVPTSSESSIV